MATLLHLDVSPRGTSSLSRQLSAAAARAWKTKNTDGQIVRRDLSKTPLSFVDSDWITGNFTPAEEHTEIHKKALALSDELVDELLRADQIIIGTPMYNFAAPAALKAWIDHVVRAGKTFSYSSGRVEGLAGGRKVLVAMASGGVYDETSGMTAYNYETPYLRYILGFMGFTDVTFIHAGGTFRVVQGQISSQEFLDPFLKQAEVAF